MNSMEILQVASYGVGLIGFVAFMISAYLITKSQVKNVTISSQDELIKTLMTDRDVQKGEIKQLTGKVANLEGQVEVLKNVPLKAISDDMRSIATSQVQITQMFEKILKSKAIEA